jgi:hypothetical protein
MKSLREYLAESEYAMTNPMVGDSVVFDIRQECLVETAVLESQNGRVILEADAVMMEILSDYGLVEGYTTDMDQAETEADAAMASLNELSGSDSEVTFQPMDEAEYQGRKVPLGKPMRGDVKKFKVYVKDPSTGNIKKVNFGDPNMRIKKNIPGRRKNFRARHRCATPGPRTKARYWSCRMW